MTMNAISGVTSPSAGATDMPPRLRALVLRYGCALATVTLAVSLRLALDPLVGDKFPFAILFLAVLFTAWYGGRGPALAAVVTGGLAADFFLISPRGTFSVHGAQEQLGLALYAATGLGISLLGGSMHAAHQRAEETAAFIGRQAAMINQTYDAVLAWDWDGLITFWNRGAELLYGFPAGSAIGRVSHTLLGTKTTDGIPALLAQLERDGAWEGELVHTARDGHLLVVESRMVLVRDPRGDYVLETNRNITERKRSDNALREANDLLESRVHQRSAELAKTYASLEASEERLRLLIEGVEDCAVFMLDPTGNVVTWNTGAERSKGYTATEIIGRHFSCFYSDDDRAAGKPERALETALRDGRYEDEAFRMRKDRSRFWARVVITALFDDQKRLRGFAKVTRDITERARAEKLLQESESRFRAAAEGMNDAFYIAATIRDGTGKIEDFRVLDCNRAATELFHRERGALIGAPQSTLTSDIPSDELIDRFRRVTDTGVPSEAELRTVDAAMVSSWHHIRVVPLEVGVAVTAADVTDRHRMNQERERHLAEKDALLREVHHRVKNNLQVVSSLLKLHGDRLSDPLARAAFSDSRDRVAAIGLLHERLCESKNLGGVDLLEYGESLVQALMRTHGSFARARVTVEATGVSLPMDLAVPWGLVLAELTSNALKHAFPETMSARPEVKIVVNADGSDLVLSVTDNGVGMPADYDLTKSRTLGMHLVKTFARQLRGEVTLNRMGGGGTRWSLRFPLLSGGTL